jgi:DNA (cytosine-5)-methyltransferase 1
MTQNKPDQAKEENDRNPLRVIELFAGIGSQAKALKNLKIPIIHHRIVEFDKYAIKSYNAIHNTNFETSDITQISGKDLGIIDTNKNDYLLTYSFPCQDLSLAGKLKGMSREDNTRSGLLWEVERLLKEVDELPQYLLMENVPNVIGKKNIGNFSEWISFLESLGYKNFYKLLNAKDYGIPQNRKRCFMISILKSKNQIYEFPKPIPLTLKLADMLEDEVDKKYFLSDTRLERVINTTYESGKLKNRLPKDGCVPTLCARDYKDPKLVEVFDFRYDEGVRGRVDNDLSPTITTKAGSKGLSGQPLLKVPEKTKKGYAEAEVGDGVYINRPHQKRGVVQKGMIQTLKTSGNDVGVVVRGNYSPSGHNASRIVDKNGLSPTVMENHGTVTAVVVGEKEYSQKSLEKVVVTNQPLRIRKLTPKECWRLMGFSDEDFDKASKVNSNSQLYKQAGNSIVVNVLMEIFKKMFIDTSIDNYQTNLFDFI